MEDKTFRVKGKLVDVVKGEIFPADILVHDGRIEEVRRLPFGDLEGSVGTILPGLVDAHVHVESSMVTPAAFAQMAVVHGTVATVSDPHEIGNVLGVRGVEYMLENAREVPFHFAFGAPSCVPATSFETAGASIDAEAVGKLLERKEIFYLSEVMNYPGVLANDAEVLAKIAHAARVGKPIDGHAPGVRGGDARRYAGHGISTDHECVALEEALDKIDAGMHILIREGSAAKNFEALLPLLDTHPERVMFCSDDKHPNDLVRGHINELVKRALSVGFDPLKVLRAATLNPVRHYKLPVGLLQGGDSADFIIVDRLEEFNVLATFVGGKRVAECGTSFIHPKVALAENRFAAKEIAADVLRLHAGGAMARVIVVHDGQLVTSEERVAVTAKDGLVGADLEHDLLKLVVYNRYRASPPAVALVKGMGLRTGAIASTVAHDSHNIIAVGASDADLVRAINALVRTQGGVCAVHGNREDVLPLPVGGLMALEEVPVVGARYERVDAFAKELGSQLHAPFMTLSFLALLVIPRLKLSDRGLFDGEAFRFTQLFC